MLSQSLPSLSDLLRPIPGPNPSGADTRHTGIYDRIREARREEPDLPQGSWIRVRKTADWNAAVDLCTDALKNKTKDLQVAAWLTEALVHRDGFPGLTLGLKLLGGLLDQFWPTLYPRSEEDELEFRAAPLEWTGSRLDFAVKSVPLSSSGTDRSGQYRARMTEVDDSLAALSRLEAIGETRFKGAAPRFDTLRRSLETVKATLEAQIGNLHAKRDWETEVEPESAPGATTAIAMWTGTEFRFDPVHFTISTPSAIEPARIFLLTLWVHLESQRADVMDRARQQHRARDLSGVMSISKGPVRIARGALLTVRLELTGARIEDPEDSVLWDGEIGCVHFLVTPPANPQNHSLPGRAVIYLSGVQVAKVQFVLQVGAVPPDGIVPTTETRTRKAFASYASADRDEVLARLQGIRKAAPYMDIFFDVLTLRSGQRWEAEIERMIPASDVFYLFWSIRASSSRWVEREWRIALGTGRQDFIDPVPLQAPDEAPPPPELASLHFNDWMLAFQRRRRCPDTT